MRILGTPENLCAVFWIMRIMRIRMISGLDLSLFRDNSFIFTQFESFFSITSRLILLFFCDMSFGKYKKHLQIIVFPSPPIIIYDFSDRRTDILLHDIQIPIILH